MKRLRALIVSFSLVSCGSGNFVGDTTKSREKGRKSQNSNPSSTPPTTTPPVATGEETNKDPNNYTLPPGTAVIPIAVGGASLTCMDDPAMGIFCFSDGSDAAKAFQPVAAWYATDLEKAWTPTTFTKNPNELYLVKVPDEVRKGNASIAVMLLDAGSFYLADMAMHRNIVADGSFEDNVIDPKKPESRSIPASAQKSWVTYIPTTDTASPAPGCSPNLELSSSALTAGFVAADQNQWVQLSSKCAASAYLMNTNVSIGIKQTIQTVIGHEYRVEYSYRKGPNSNMTPILQFKFDNITAPITVANTEWKTQTNNYIAYSSSIVIAFEQLTAADDGAGINIDKISVIDITAELNNQTDLTPK